MSKYFARYWKDSAYDASSPESMTGLKRKLTFPWGEETLDMSFFQAAVSSVSTLGGSVKLCLNGNELVPEHVLLEWFLDHENLERMDFIYRSLPADEAAQMNAFTWLANAVRDVFNIQAAMIEDLTVKDMIEYLKTKNVLQIESQDKEYFALVGYEGNEEDDECFVTKEGWQHDGQFGMDCPNQLSPRAIAYWL